MNLNQLREHKAAREAERAAYYLFPLKCACGAVIGFESARRGVRSCSRPCAVVLQQATLKERYGGSRSRYISRLNDSKP